MTLRLVVKGNAGSAAMAAFRHGLSYTLVRSNAADGETILRTDDEHLNVVEAWFNEAPSRAPFPVGTLLHFMWEGLDGDLQFGSKR